MGPHESSPSESTQTRDVQDVLDGIRRIVQSLRESSRESERLAGLSAAQAFVLARLAEQDGLSVNELAQRTFTHQSSVSEVLSRLVRRRLVVQRPDPQDRRRRLLTITPRGRQVLAGVPRAAQERLVAAVVAMPPAHRRTVGRALQQIADAMLAERRAGMFFHEGRA